MFCFVLWSYVFFWIFQHFPLFWNCISYISGVHGCHFKDPKKRKAINTENRKNFFHLFPSSNIHHLIWIWISYAWILPLVIHPMNLTQHAHVYFVFCFFFSFTYAMPFCSSRCLKSEGIWHFSTCYMETFNWTQDEDSKQLKNWTLKENFHPKTAFHYFPFSKMVTKSCEAQCKTNNDYSHFSSTNLDIQFWKGDTPRGSRVHETLSLSVGISEHLSCINYFVIFITSKKDNYNLCKISDLENCL